MDLVRKVSQIQSYDFCENQRWVLSENQRNRIEHLINPLLNYHVPCWNKWHVFTVYIAHCRTCPVESNYAQFSSSLKCLETLETLETVGISLTLTPAGVSKPIGSMYGIYGNIYHQYTPFMLAYIPAPWILWDWYPIKCLLLMDPSPTPGIPKFSTRRWNRVGTALSRQPPVKPWRRDLSHWIWHKKIYEDLW